LTVLDDRHLQHKVRLAGIDAPEKGQDFGQWAKQNLSAMVNGMRVTVALCCANTKAPCALGARRLVASS
jgi:endonuclease YncB( thermonuclease family)